MEVQDIITIAEETSAKPTMTDEEEATLVRQIMNGEVNPNASIEPQKAPETAKAPDTQSIPDDAAIQQTLTAEAAVTATAPPPKTEEENYKIRYENLAKKLGEQAAELSRLRTQQPPQTAPFAFPVQRPAGIPQPTPANEPFDFTDPNSVAKVAQRAVDEALARQREQQAQMQNQQFIQNWHAQTAGEKARLAAEKGVSEEVIDAAQAHFNQAFAAGKLPEIAYTYANLPTIIQEAEKRGEANALAKIQQAQNAPKRAAAASSATATTTGKLEDMSPAELKQYMNSLDPVKDERRLEQVGRFLMRFET